MWWTDWKAALTSVLDDERFKQLFEHHPEVEITLLKGSCVTRLTSSFTKGQFWGEYREAKNIPFPIGSFAAVFAEGTMVVDRTGDYVAEIDLEEYQLFLTARGLQHRIIHRYRHGFRGATPGPDGRFERGLRDEIQWSGFVENEKGLLARRWEYCFVHELDNSVKEILYQANIPLKKVVRALRRAASRCLDDWMRPPKKTSRFRPLGVTGVEKADGTMREATLTGMRKHFLKGGSVVEARPHGHVHWK